MSHPLYRIVSRSPSGARVTDLFDTFAEVLAALPGIAQIRTVEKVEGTQHGQRFLPYEEKAIADAIGKAIKVFDVGIIRRK